MSLSLSLGLNLGSAALGTGVGYPAGTIYVSKTATNGFAIGSDSYSAAQATDRSTPFASIAKAAASVANGGYVVINDGDYTGAELGPSNYPLFNGSTVRMATYKAHNRHAVRFVGTDATYLTRITTVASAGLTLTLDGIHLDAGNVSANCLSDTDATGNFHTVNMLNCKFTNPTIRAVSVASTKHAYNIVNPIHVGTATRSLFYCTTATSGCSMTVQGGTSTITQQNSNNGVVEYRATEAGASMSVTGLTINSTLLSSLTGGGTHDGICAYNVSTVVANDNSVSIVGLYGTRLGACIRASVTLAVDVAAMVMRNVLHNGTTGGYGVLIGTDGTGTGNARCNNPIVDGNTITGDASGQTSALHGILLGFQEGGSVTNNTLSGCALALIQKKNTTTPALFATNTIRLSAFPNVGYSIAMYGKGAVGTKFYQNSVYVNDSSTNDAQIQHVQPDEVSGTVSTGIEYKNNAIYFTGSATIRFVNCANGSTATFANNVYWSTGALPSNAFSYAAVGYASVALWAAAREATAISGDPKFTDAANDNFVLLADSPCIAAGGSVGVSTDKVGAAFGSPPSIGAYEFAA